MNTAPALVQAIVAAHPTLALPLRAQPALTFSSEAPVYRAAKQATLALGFIECDAECLAQAWQKQTERLGSFSAHDWPDQPIDFGLPASPQLGAFAPCPQKLGLYAVLPDAAWVGRMARAGVPTVQLRFKSDDATAVAQEIRAAVQAVRGTGALLFINDHWQAALEAGAYGVHLGQEDLADANLEALRQAGVRLGISSHGYFEMVKADRLSPSYIALGAVYPTTLKKMQTAPQGAGRLRAYARLLQHRSLVAIGGIDQDRMGEVLASGVGSVAVVRALVAADDPEATAHTLQALVSA